MNKFDLKSFITITTTKYNQTRTTTYNQIRNFNQYCKVIKTFFNLRNQKLNPTITVHFFKDRLNQRIDSKEYGSNIASFIKDFTDQFIPQVKKPKKVEYDLADEEYNPQFK